MKGQSGYMLVTTGVSLMELLSMLGDRLKALRYNLFPLQGTRENFRLAQSLWKGNTSCWPSLDRPEPAGT